VRLAALAACAALLSFVACANEPLPSKGSSPANGAQVATTNTVPAAATNAAPAASTVAVTPNAACQSAAAAATLPSAIAGGDRYGAPIDEATQLVALADVVKDPAKWAGKRVRTRGEVVAVCQAAGCWCDLKPEGETKAIVPTHVSMHGHAFFLPKSIKSRTVEVEGVLATRALSKQETDHYNSEGASLTPGEPVVTIDALGVAAR
jgi:hypothetical protein